MSEEKSGTTYYLFNERDQPVELYLGQRVVVVPARAWVELQEIDLTSPQIQTLRDRQHVTVREAPGEGLGGDEAKVAEGRRSSERGNGEAKTRTPEAPSLSTGLYVTRGTGGVRPHPSWAGVLPG